MPKVSDLNPENKNIKRESIQLSDGDSVIEGGPVSNIDSSKIGTDPIKRQKALTARTLA